MLKTQNKCLMNNEEDIHFLQNSPFDTDYTYFNEFFID